MLLPYAYATKRKQTQEERLCEQVIDRNRLYLLPSDYIIDSMDNDTLYHIFDKYVNSYQFHCCNVSRQGLRGGSGKNICADDRFKPSDPCIVYSFGSKFDFAFEDDVWRSFKCEIHTFDPSLSFEKSQIPYFVNFHLIGLSGKDFNQTKPGNRRYHNTLFRKVWEMQRLSTIQKVHSHKNKIIDILKIDIEGWEWDALPDILLTESLRNVKQICLEVHFGFRHKHSKNTWGNVPIQNQLKILKRLYETGFRIFMSQTFEWRSLYIQGRKISTLNELSFININF
ncbi:probable methyltransferase-like protein 24 isoform X2 [Mercenaria mercenaria]|uniref:probable methyltransferase-like protein 24 isoform X2 n=1 Tax=Mercenaria mercenaria TaxID=6596 RepID=UPI00234EAD7D|nr:probable methyltransferase-like protein 24 isoform X2 [Mercenaria mercenaria]